jgi:hypothetical protein
LCRFSIPSDELVRQIWVSRINNPKLIEVPEHAVAYYRVCARHFHDMCFVTGSNNKKLQRYSLPTLNLIGIYIINYRLRMVLISYQFVGFDLPSTKETCLRYPETPAAYPITPEKLRGI